MSQKLRTKIVFREACHRYGPEFIAQKMIENPEKDLEEILELIDQEADTENKSCVF